LPGIGIFDIIMEMTELPIDGYRDHIRDALKKNPVLLITAETGAGKSTRVPYWFWSQGKKVAVTQPRRIAARSLSYYQSQVTATRWGTDIGYQTGFDRKYSRQTRLLYLTDGVQMVREIKGQRDYDVLILDEVHEWNLNQEVLIGLVKKALDSQYFNKTGQRVIIMSATLHTQKLSGFLNQAPVISVPGRSFPVTMHHNNPDFLLSDTVQMIEMEKNLLVFQPGKSEIKAFIALLNQTLEQDGLKAKILPLHSELSIKDQARVFQHYSVPKVVVATDIAQTSLTIDDIDAVIDTGIKKELRVIKGIEGLYPTDISYSECLQRAGRAGRVKNGQYILCADLGLKDRLPYSEPEIRRLNLESVVLRLIKWGLPPLEFPYFHSPKKNLIYKALKQLKIFGAISKQEKITQDGEKMAEIPVSIRSSRLLMEAQKTSPEVMDNALKLIAILETKGIVNKEYLGEKYYSGPINSDLINQLFIWNNPGTNRKSINHKKFSLAKDIYQELKNRLGIRKSYRGISDQNLKALTRIMLSAFLDHVYVKTGKVYARDNEERELDRTSVLFPSLPDVIVGIPFDLIIDWENQDTGEKEKKCLSLITFATELSAQQLHELQPYSYSKQQEVIIENNHCRVKNTLFFGGRNILEYESKPDWNDPEQKSLLLLSITTWHETNRRLLKFYPRLDEAKKYYRQIERLITQAKIRIPSLSSFNKLWNQYLSRELHNHFKTDDLKLFFNLHPGFLNLNLSQLLPREIIRELIKIKWPPKLVIGETDYILHRIRDKTYVKLDMGQFEKIEKDNLMLPTGEQTGLILNDRKFMDWDVAVYHFNRWKKRKIFDTKWRNQKKVARVEDLANISFPVKFKSGQSKANTPFEFYSAPHIEGYEVFLIHFFEEKTAQSYFESMKDEWTRFLQKYEKEKIESVFKKKGWKVK